MSDYYEDAARLLLARLGELVPPGKKEVRLPISGPAARYRLAWINARRRAAEEAYAGLRWLEMWRDDLDEKDAEIAVLRARLAAVEALAMSASRDAAGNRQMDQHDFTANEILAAARGEETR